MSVFPPAVKVTGGDAKPPAASSMAAARDAAVKVDPKAAPPPPPDPVTVCPQEEGAEGPDVAPPSLPIAAEPLPPESLQPIQSFIENNLQRSTRISATLVFRRRVECQVKYSYTATTRTSARHIRDGREARSSGLT